MTEIQETTNKQPIDQHIKTIYTVTAILAVAILVIYPIVLILSLISQALMSQ